MLNNTRISSTTTKPPIANQNQSPIEPLCEEAYPLQVAIGVMNSLQRTVESVFNLIAQAQSHVSPETFGASVAITSSLFLNVEAGLKTLSNRNIISDRMFTTGLSILNALSSVLTVLLPLYFLGTFASASDDTSWGPPVLRWDVNTTGFEPFYAHQLAYAECTYSNEPGLYSFSNHGYLNTFAQVRSRLNDDGSCVAGMLMSKALSLNSSTLNICLSPFAYPYAETGFDRAGFITKANGTEFYSYMHIGPVFGSSHLSLFNGERRFDLLNGTDTRGFEHFSTLCLSIKNDLPTFQVFRYYNNKLSATSVDNHDEIEVPTHYKPQFSRNATTRIFLATYPDRNSERIPSTFDIVVSGSRNSEN